MRAKKYLWTLAAVYTAYLTYGIQVIVISQNLDQLASQWSTTTAGVYGTLACTGLAKFLSIWAFGKLSDRLGRKRMIVSGAILYIGFFIGLMSTMSYGIANVCAFLAGLAASFFDVACYPAAQESWIKAPNSAVFTIKGVISISGLVYPLLVIFFRGSGIWRAGLIIPGIMSILILILAFIAPYSHDEALKKEREADKRIIKAKEKSLRNHDEDTKIATHSIVSEPPIVVAIVCILFGFIMMSTMYSAQQLLTRYGLSVIGMSDLKAATLLSLYTFGSLCSAILWSIVTVKFRWRTIKLIMINLFGTAIAYSFLCTNRNEAAIQISALAIGFFAAGGALQCSASLMQELNPGNRGKFLGIYFTIMELATFVTPVTQAVFTKQFGEGDAILKSFQINLGFALLGAFLMLYLALNYKKWFGKSLFTRRS